jgi:hypothetical protein
VIPPLDKQTVLNDLRDATYVTHLRLRLGANDPKFALFLKDEAFAKTAQGIVKDKISHLKAAKDDFPSLSGQKNTLHGWQSLLAKIEDSLYQGAPER